jgi:alpha-beta hydrolase superfamily lysophospholipase
MREVDRSTVTRLRDGTELFVRDWSAAGTPWLRALIVHGVEDHSGRYRRVGQQYAANGIDVTAFDQRWSGRSGGPRGDAESWGQLLDDLEERVEAAREAAAGLPIAIHGQSFGGLLVADYLLVGRPLPDLAVLSAPGLGDCLARWKHIAAPLLARIAPTMRLANGVDPVSLARDRRDEELFGPDPLRIGHSTARFGAAGFAAQARVSAAVRAVGAMPVRTLVIHGAADRLVPPSASEPFEGLGNTWRIVYPDLRHELHNEPDGPAVIADVVGWLRERTGERLAPAE